MSEPSTSLNDRLEEVRKNQDVIDRLSKYNTLLVESMIRDNAILHLSNLKNLPKNAQVLISNIVGNGSGTHEIVSGLTRESYVHELAANDHIQTTAVAPKKKTSSAAVNKHTAPAKRKYVKQGPNKVESGFWDRLLLNFGRQNKNIINVHAFREKYRKTYPSFLDTFFYIIRKRLIENGVVEPIDGDKNNLRIVNLGAATVHGQPMDFKSSE